MNLKEHNLNQLLKLSVDQRSIPQFVYKYRALDNPNTNKIFNESSLWFSQPFDFNDPFDCQVTVETNNTVVEIADFLVQNASHLSDTEILNLSIHCIQNPLEWNKMIKTNIQKSINEKGVCCFADNNNNILMWSHYANSHKGICLKFDRLADPDFFSNPFQVNYREEYPHYNHVKDNSKLISQLIQSKSYEWKYEGEIRILKSSGGAYKFKKAALKEISFGCNCSAEDILKIQKLSLENDFNVTFQKLRKKKEITGYQLKRYCAPSSAGLFECERLAQFLRPVPAYYLVYTISTVLFKKFING